MNITLEQAQKVIAACIKKSEELNINVNVAVVDSGARLVAFSRMNEAVLGAIDIAIKKAETSMLFKKNSGDLGKLSQPGAPLYNIEHSNSGLITFPGGVPLKNSSKCIIGAVGISGSSVENDHTVAQAGAKSI